MGANVQPQFGANANIGTVAVTAANTSSQGGGTIGTNIFLAFSPGANGSWLDFLRWMPTASAASTSTAATLARVFLSTQSSGTTTSANTWLIDEAVLPSVTADSASTVANQPVDRPLGFRIPPTMFVLVTHHIAPNASTQWIAVTFAQDY